MPPLTAKDVTISLYWAMRGSSQLLIPRYTPHKWWECDLWRLTKADMVDEYEIKMSVADFRADVRKDEQRYEIDPITRRYSLTPRVTKHELLAGDQRGPNRFWFVVPTEIADKIQIPPYAGLLVFGRGGSPGVRTQAPRRHGRKWDGNKLLLFSTFYHRYWTHEAKSKESTEPSQEPITDLDAELPPAAKV